MKTFEFKSNGKFTVTVDAYNVTITLKGVMNFVNKGGSKGTKRIPLSEITAVQFKEPRITTGYIQFAYNGSVETKGGPLAAVKDENTVTFNQKEVEQARALVAYIEEQRAALRQPATVVHTAPSSADEITKLHELMQQGILTEDEFNAKKKQLLGI